MPASLTNSWKPLNIGAGGYLTGIDVAPDDTMVVRTDTYGAYIWNGTQWQQVITSTSMPASDVTTNGAQGVYEIQIAPSSTNILYMEYQGNVYRSDNKGTTWTKTAFANVVENPNDTYRMDGQKMAIDPNNPNVVYVGTPQNGLFVTTDGGASWQKLGAVPISATDSQGIYPGITGIAFDPASGTTGGKTNTIYASSFGHGVFESTNGGASWSALAGGPSDVEYATVSKTGVYYAVGNNNSSVWKYTNGNWTELLSGGASSFHTVAVDPFNSNRILVDTLGGSLNQSLDGGATWSGQNWGNKFSATDVPWLATTSQYMSIGGVAFDQLVPNKVWASDGVGVWNASVPTKLLGGTPIVWNSQSAGIEQLVANEIIVPPGGHPVVASWDRAFFYVNNPDVAPSNVAIPGFAAGWSLDYASSNPTFLVGIADWWGTEKSGYSTDGGQTWNLFPTMPSFAGKTIGGTIAASSPTDIVWAPADGYAPVYTTDGGQTWHNVVLPGVTDWSGFDFAYYLDKQTVTADRVLPDTFYLYYNGVYKSTDGGATWTEVYNKEISYASNFNSKLEAVPGEAGNLFFTGGPQTAATHPVGEHFYQSTDGGASWTAVPNVLEVKTFGFGAPATPGGYPSIYIVGWVNSVYGIWQSNDDAKSWTQIGTYPTDSLDNIRTISGDPNTYGQVYVGFAGSGYAYLPAASNTTPTTPAAPTITSFSPDSGTLGDGITNATVLTLTGTAEASSTVKIYDGSTLLGATTADSNGAWSFATAKLPNGSHAFTATSTDTAGNISAASSALTVTVDTVAPIAPTVTNNGIVGDIITSATVLTLTGTSEANSAVKIYDGSTLLGTAMADANGTWSLTTAKLGDGAHAFTATATDSAGNVSPVSSSLAVEVDTALMMAMHTGAALAPTIDSFSPDSGTIGDGITSAKVLTLIGTAEAGSTVKVYDGSTVLGAAIADSSGSWHFATKALADGSHAFTVTATDPPGYTSAASSLLTVIVDSVVPVVTERLLVDTGPSSIDKATSNDSLTGTAKENSVVTLMEGANVLGSVKADATGLWTFMPIGLSDGWHTITAIDTDAAGLTGKASLDFRLDTTAPNVQSDVLLGVSGGIGVLHSGSSVVFTLDLNEGAYVAGGIPALKLNDGGTATYDAQHSTPTALAFDYTVAPGQNASSLAVTGVNLNGATVTDLAGNAVNFAGAPKNFSGIIVDTSTPVAAADHSHLAAGNTLTTAANVGVLANDQDTDPYDTLSVSAVNGQSASVGHTVNGEFGTLMLNADGSYIYHNTNVAAVTALGGVAEDVFTYTANNGHGGVANSTLSVAITGPGETYVSGASGNTIAGGSGSYILDGSAGNVTAVAGQGTQFIFGGRGDTLTAGSGSDTFIFAATFGKNTVNSFDTHHDTIELSKAAFANAGAVLANAHQVGSDTVITYDAADTITLTHTRLQDLHANNFILA